MPHPLLKGQLGTSPIPNVLPLKAEFSTVYPMPLLCKVNGFKIFKEPSNKLNHRTQNSHSTDSLPPPNAMDCILLFFQEGLIPGPTSNNHFNHFHSLIQMQIITIASIFPSEPQTLLEFNTFI